MKEFQKLNIYVKLAIYIAIIIVVYIAIKRVSAWIKVKNSNFELKQEQNVYESQGQTLSYPNSQYKTYAQVLENSNGWINDDEDSIYGVFEAMQNDLDILQLEKEYRALYNRGIADFLADVFYRSEIEKVNAILSANNINRQY